MERLRVGVIGLGWFGEIHCDGIVAMSARRNIPAAWTAEIRNKIGPIVGEAIHDADLMLWFTQDAIVSAYAQTVDVRGLKYPDMSRPDERIDMSGEPAHEALCGREQRFLLEAIDEDRDLTAHMNDAVRSLQMIVAADKSIHKGQVVELAPSPKPKSAGRASGAGLGR